MILKEFFVRIKETRDLISNDFETYLKFLKTMSNNHNKILTTQISIFNVNPEFKACASFNVWNNYGRKIKAGEKGIPYIDKNNSVSYLFDVSQTEIRNENLLHHDDKNRWSFEVEKDSRILDEFIMNHFYSFIKSDNEFSEFYKNNNLESIEKKADLISVIYMNEYFKEVEKDIRKLEFNNKEKFILNSLNLLIANKFNLNELEKNVDKEFLNEYYKTLTEKEFYSILTDINLIYQKYIKEFITKSKELRKELDQYEYKSITESNRELGTTTNIRGLGRDGINLDGQIWTSSRPDGRDRISDRERIIENEEQSIRSVKAGLSLRKRDRLQSRQYSKRVANSTERISEQHNNRNIEESTDFSRRILSNTVSNLSESVRSGQTNGEISTRAESRELPEISSDAEQHGTQLNDGNKNTVLLELEQEENKIKGEQISLFNSAEQEKETQKEKEININIIDKEEKNKDKYNENFKITSEMQAEKLTPSERLNYNIEAILMLKRLEKGERELDFSAQEVLSKYVGWGGLADVFDETKVGQWEVTRNFLKENLTEEEYENARESTLTAFYTPKIVIDSIYKTLNNLGFEKGNILEPSCGVGNFIGNVPDKMQNSKFYGVELDTISGNISKYLYPNSNIQIKGFEKTEFSNNFFDVAIGNIPFGNFKVSDNEYNKNNFMIHDYFFAKSIDKVRPGGVIAFITSSGTLDKENSSIREYLGSRCELLGAIRLPNNTFKGVAGTDVMTDIIFLQKNEKILDTPKDWYFLGVDNNNLKYNNYFIQNPNMIIGNIVETNGKFGPTNSCVLDSDKDFKTELNKAILNIKGKIKEIEILDPKETNIETLEADATVKNFSFTTINDIPYYRNNSIMFTNDTFKQNKNKINAYVSFNLQLRDLLDKQRNFNIKEEEIKKFLEEVNESYDNFINKYGYFNSRQNKKIFKDDNNFPLISSLEKFNKNEYVGKADILLKRTFRPIQPISFTDNPTDALISSLNTYGSVNLKHISKLLHNNDINSVIDSLKGQIYLNAPSSATMRTDLVNICQNIENSTFQTKDEFLSGNIMKKLRNVDSVLWLVQNALNNNDYNYMKKDLEFYEQLLLKNKEDLTKVLPKKIEHTDIIVNLGASWIDTNYYEDFIIDILDSYHRVSYSNHTNIWSISNKSYSNVKIDDEFGTSRINALHILEKTLNLRDCKVFDKVHDESGKEKSILNMEETALALEKQELLRREFQDWIFRDPERRDSLVSKYNRLFNNNVNQEFDGSYFKFENSNSSIELKKHQKDAVARIVQSGNTLLAHCVGAGKTYTMIASAMESKRLGLCNKPLFVVPNHLTEQIGSDFLNLYPNANILIATKSDFDKQNRKKFISKIATGNYDGIILGHSQFEKITLSPEKVQSYYKNEIQNLENFIREFRFSSDKFSTKQAEQSKKKLKVKLENLLNEKKKDDLINFEILGIDRLYVDEAHYFKNLYLYTKLSNVAGIPQAESQRALDMFFKVKYMNELTDYKGVVFATGTPISNTMAELYTMQRYLQYNSLEERNLEHFDNWASTFGEVITGMELAPEGNSYRMVSRFSKFNNIPTLINLFKEVADIKTESMLDLPTPRCIYHNIVTSPSDEQKYIMSQLADRADDIRHRKVDPREDCMLVVTNDGKKLSIDQRLLGIGIDNPNSKVNTCINNVFDIYKKNENKVHAQVIFLDTSVPSKEFNLYDDIKEKLIQKGVPAHEIAFVHDAKNEAQKEDLFNRVKNGEIKVFLGSTQKCGTGTNMQDNLVALHHLDVAWRPSDIEQREGRIKRRGNKNSEVDIYKYITEGTFDAYLWQILEQKQNFIDQVLSGEHLGNSVEDVGGSKVLDCAEAKALALGNPLLKRREELVVEIKKLEISERKYNKDLVKLSQQLENHYPQLLENLNKEINNLKVDIENTMPLPIKENKNPILVDSNNLSEKQAEKDKNKEFVGITLKGTFYKEKDLAGKLLLSTIKQTKMGEENLIGNYRNFNISITFESISKKYYMCLQNKSKKSYYVEVGDSELGNFTRLDNAIAKLPEMIEQKNKEIEQTKKDIANVKELLQKPFQHKDRIIEAKKELSIVNLNLENSTNSVNSWDLKKQEEQTKGISIVE